MSNYLVIRIISYPIKTFVIAVMSNYLVIRIISDPIKTMVSTFVSSVHVLTWHTSANVMVHKILSAHRCICTCYR